MRRILLVDDERIERGGIRMLLGRMPEEFEIVEAANGVEALQKLEHEKVDFILTDIKMPQMDGMELIQRVRQTDEKIPIAIFSGFGEFSFAQKAIRYGVSKRAIICRICIRIIVWCIRERTTTRLCLAGWMSCQRRIMHLQRNIWTMRIIRKSIRSGILSVWPLAVWQISA